MRSRSYLTVLKVLRIQYCSSRRSSAITTAPCRRRWQQVAGAVENSHSPLPHLGNSFLALYGSTECTGTVLHFLQFSVLPIITSPTMPVSYPPYQDHILYFVPSSPLVLHPEVGSPSLQFPSIHPHFRGLPSPQNDSFPGRNFSCHRAWHPDSTVAVLYYTAATIYTHIICVQAGP
jgi:hypothetical protein